MYTAPNRQNNIKLKMVWFYIIESIKIKILYFAVVKNIKSMNFL